MQREPQDFFYERAVYNASHCVIRQLEKGDEEYEFPLHNDPNRVLYRYSLYEDTDNEPMTDSMHNMQFLEERPADASREI